MTKHVKLSTTYQGRSQGMAGEAISFLFITRKYIKYEENLKFGKNEHERFTRLKIICFSCAQNCTQFNQWCNTHEVVNSNFSFYLRVMTNNECLKIVHSPKYINYYLFYFSTLNIKTFSVTVNVQSHVMLKTYYYPLSTKHKNVY